MYRISHGEILKRFKNKDEVIAYLADGLAQYAETQVTVDFPDGSQIATPRWDA